MKGTSGRKKVRIEKGERDREEPEGDEFNRLGRE